MVILTAAYISSPSTVIVPDVAEYITPAIMSCVYSGTNCDTMTYGFLITILLVN